MKQRNKGQKFKLLVFLNNFECPQSCWPCMWDSEYTALLPVWPQLSFMDPSFSGGVAKPIDTGHFRYKNLWMAFAWSNQEALHSLSALHDICNMYSGFWSKEGSRRSPGKGAGKARPFFLSFLSILSVHKQVFCRSLHKHRTEHCLKRK